MSINIKAVIDNSQLRTTAAEARRIIEGVGQQARQEGDAVSRAFSRIGGAVGGVLAVGQFSELATKVATVRGEFQQLEIAFETMLGNKQRANALMQQLATTAAKTPFGMNDIAASAKQLLAYGLEAEKVNDTLIRLGDIAAGLSIPIGDLAYLYGTTMVQGRLYTQDLNQFLGRGIPLMGELAAQFGVAESEVKKLVEEGKVGFPQVQRAIENLTSEGSTFGGLMAKQAESITGLLSNLEDGFTMMLNDIGRETEGIIADSIKMAATLVENWRSVAEAIKVAVGVVGAYKAAQLIAASAGKVALTAQYTQEATTLHALLDAERKAAISKQGLAVGSAEYAAAVRLEIDAQAAAAASKVEAAQLEVQSAQTTLSSAQTQVAAARAKVAAAQEEVAAKQAALSAAIQEAQASHLATQQKIIDRQRELQSRNALTIKRLEEQRQTAIEAAQELKKQGASEAARGAKQREIATIQAKIVSAKAEESQISRTIAAARAEIATGGANATSKRVQTATNALNTAQKNLDTAATRHATAATALNTAQTTLSTAQTNLNTASETANTIATGINTASKKANITTTGILATATATLEKGFARLNAVMAANKYALIAAAVAALGYAVYRAATYVSDAERRTKALNAAMIDASVAAAKEEQKIDDLYRNLRAAKKGTEEYQAAKDAIQKQYGAYLQGLTNEQGRVLDVADAYTRLKEEVMKAARARQMQAVIEEQGGQMLEDQAHERKTLLNIMAKRYGKERLAADGRTPLYIRMAQLAEEGRLDASKYKETHYYQGGDGIHSVEVNYLRDSLKRIKQGKDAYKSFIEEVYAAYGIEEGYIDPASKADSKTTSSISAQLDKKTGGGKQPPTAEEIAQMRAKAQEQLAQMNQEEQMAAREAILSIEAARIESLSDGLDKELAQNALAHEQRLLALDREKADTLERLRDKAEAEWQAAHPKEAAEGKKFDRSSITTLTPEEQAADAEARQRSQAQQLADDQRVKQKLLDQHRTFAQQRQAIDQEYSQKAADLTQAGATPEQLAVLGREREEALRAVNDKEMESLQTSSTLFASLFQGAAGKTQAELQKVIATTRQLLDYLASTKTADIAPTLGFTTEQLRNLAQQPERLKVIREQLSQLEAVATRHNPFQALAHALEELGKKDGGVEEKRKRLNTLAEAAASAASQIGGVASSLATAFADAGGGLGELFAGIATAMKSSDNLAKGFLQRGFFGLAVAGIQEGANLIGQAFAAERRHREALQALRTESLTQQLAYNAALREEVATARELSTLFGTLDFGRARAQYRSAQMAVEALTQALRGTAEEQAKMAKGSNVEEKLDQMLFSEIRNYTELEKKFAGLAAVQVKVGHKKTGLFGWGKGRDVFDGILNVYPELIDKNGQFNRTLAETILKTRTLDDAGKRTLEQLIALHDEATKAEESIRNYLGGIFGELGDKLTDAIVSAFRNGEDASKTFAGSVGSMLEQLGADMLQSALFAPILQRAQEQMMAITKQGGDEAERFAAYATLMKQITAQYATAKGEADLILRAQQEAAKAAGFDIYQPQATDRREGAQRGIAQASQDSIDQLSARATTIQSHTYAIAEGTRLLTANTAAILQSVANIEHHTATMADQLRAVRNDLEDINQRGVKMR